MAAKFSFGTPTPAASTSNLFGGTPAASAAPATPFSFGTPTPQSSTPQASTGLFGTSSPASGGLFGSQPASTSTGLFGTPSSQPTSTTPSLFGATPAPAQPLLFGSSQPAAAPLFGASQPPAQSSLFGAAQPAATTSLFGSQPAPAATQQQQPQVALTKASKFEELPEAEKKYVQDLETFIQGRKTVAEELKARDLGASIAQTAQTLKEVSAEYNGLLSVLDHASRSSDDVRRRFDLDLDDVCRAVKIIDHFKGNTSSAAINQATKGVVDSNFPFKFFKRKADEMADRLKLYHDTIEELQGQLLGHESDQVKAILPTLRAQHALALSLASKIAATHEDLTELKQVYTVLYRQKTGAKDPFIDAGLFKEEPLSSVRGVQELRLR